VPWEKKRETRAAKSRFFKKCSGKGGGRKKHSSLAGLVLVGNTKKVEALKR